LDGCGPLLEKDWYESKSGFPSWQDFDDSLSYFFHSPFPKDPPLGKRAQAADYVGSDCTPAPSGGDPIQRRP